MFLLSNKHFLAHIMRCLLKFKKISLIPYRPHFFATPQKGPFTEPDAWRTLLSAKGHTDPVEGSITYHQVFMCNRLQPCSKPVHCADPWPARSYPASWPPCPTQPQPDVSNNSTASTEDYCTEQGRDKGGRIS